MSTANSAVRPRLVPRAVHYPVGNDGVLLVTESEGVFSLPGAFWTFWTRLLPVLDGTRSISQIANSFADPKEIIELYRGLFLLNARGLVLDGPAPREAAPLFWHADKAAPVAVRIEKVGRDDDAALQRILELAGIGLERDASVAVVVTDDYRQPDLREINRRQLELRKPWLLLKYQGWRTGVGPVFTPENGPCWECLYSRLKVNMMEVEYAEALGSAYGTSPGAATACTQMLLALAAPIIERLCLTGSAGALVNTIWTIDLHTMAHQNHHVVRLLQCWACGSPQLAGASDEFQLHPRTTNDSGYRSNSPWLTYERFRHHVSPISGAVPELRPALLDENPFHLFTAGINPTRQISSARELLRFSLRIKSAGKGPTREQAIAALSQKHSNATPAPGEAMPVQFDLEWRISEVRASIPARS
jgi:oxazoline/thiazoline synthase